MSLVPRLFVTLLAALAPWAVWALIAQDYTHMFDHWARRGFWIYITVACAFSVFFFTNTKDSR